MVSLSELGMACWGIGRGVSSLPSFCAFSDRDIPEEGSGACTFLRCHSWGRTLRISEGGWPYGRAGTGT